MHTPKHTHIPQSQKTYYKKKLNCKGRVCNTFVSFVFCLIFKGSLSFDIYISTIAPVTYPRTHKDILDTMDTLFSTASMQICAHQNHSHTYYKYSSLLMGTFSLFLFENVSWTAVYSTFSYLIPTDSCSFFNSNWQMFFFNRYLFIFNSTYCGIFIIHNMHICPLSFSLVWGD